MRLYWLSRDPFWVRIITRAYEQSNPKVTVVQTATRFVGSTGVTYTSSSRTLGVRVSNLGENPGWATKPGTATISLLGLIAAVAKRAISSRSHYSVVIW